MLPYDSCAMCSSSPAKLSTRCINCYYGSDHYQSSGQPSHKNLCKEISNQSAFVHTCSTPIILYLSLTSARAKESMCCNDFSQLGWNTTRLRWWILLKEERAQTTPWGLWLNAYVLDVVGKGLKGIGDDRIV